MREERRPNQRRPAIEPHRCDSTGRRCRRLSAARGGCFVAEAQLPCVAAGRHHLQIMVADGSRLCVCSTAQAAGSSGNFLIQHRAGMLAVWRHGSPPGDLLCVHQQGDKVSRSDMRRQIAHTGGAGRRLFRTRTAQRSTYRRASGQHKRGKKTLTGDSNKAAGKRKATQRSLARRMSGSIVWPLPKKLSIDRTTIRCTNNIR